MLHTILWQADGWKWLISRPCLNHLTVFSGKSNIDSSMVPSSMWVWDSSLWSVVTANSCITSSGIEAANVLAGVSCARMTDWGSTLGDLISLECLRQGCSSYRVWFREPTRMTFSGLKLKSNMWMRPETDRTFLPGSPSIWKEFQTSGTQFLLLKAPLSFFFFSLYVYHSLRMALNSKARAQGKRLSEWS